MKNSFHIWRSLVCLMAALCALGSAPAHAAATFNITYLDAAGFGFNDPTPATPVGGNNGTTLGQQRKNVFESVLSQWGQWLNGTVPIDVKAEYKYYVKDGNPDLNVLASALPVNLHKDFIGSDLPIDDTWYPSALANQLVGRDLNTTFGDTSDIHVYVNAYYPTFYHGLDGEVPPGDDNYDLHTILQHEIAHGLGFYSVLAQNGAWSPPVVDWASFWESYPMVYDRFLCDSTGTKVVDMTQAGRAGMTTTNSLYWSGTNATNGNGGTFARIHAPVPTQDKPYSAGSWISHLDSATYSFGGLGLGNSLNEMQTPEDDGPIHSFGPVAIGVFRDIGWEFSDSTPPGVTISSPTDGFVAGSLTEISGTASDPNNNATGLKDVQVAIKRPSDNKWWNWNTSDWTGSALQTRDAEISGATPLIPIATGSKSWAISWSGGVANGQYDIYARARDQRMNASNWDINSLEIDRVPPAVSFDAPLTAGAKVQNLENVSINATDAHGVSSAQLTIRETGTSGRGYWSGTAWTSSAQVLNATKQSDGKWKWIPGAGQRLPNKFDLIHDRTYVLQARATDTNSNQSDFLNCSITVTAELDITPPVVAFVPPPANNDFVNAIPALKWTASDPNGVIKGFVEKVEFSIYEDTSVTGGRGYWNGTNWINSGELWQLATKGTGDEWTTGTFRLPVKSEMAQGKKYIIRVKATDDSRNASNPNLSKISLTGDVEAPTVAYLTPTANATMDFLETITGTTSDQVGASGVARVELVLKRTNDGKFWTGISLSPARTPLATTLTGSGTLNWDYPGDFPLGSGTYQLEATSFDNAGNSTVITRDITLGNGTATPDVYWTNTAGGDWNTGSNWSSGSVPTLADFAIIGRSGTYTVTHSGGTNVAGDVLIGGRNGAQKLSITGGSLSPNNVTARPLGTVTLEGGTLAGATVFKKGVNFGWTTGVVANSLQIEPGVVLTVSGVNNKTLAQKTVVNNLGTINWNGGGPFFTDAYYSPGNGSIINNKAGSVFNLAGDGVPFRIDYFASTFNNEAASGTKAAGKLVKTAGSGTTSLNSWVFNNAGEIRVQSGILEHAGTLNMNGGSFTGTGALATSPRHKSISTINVQTGNPTISNTVFEINNGGVTSATGASLSTTATGRIEWSGGTIAGTFNLNPGATMDILSESTKHLAKQAVVNNQGNINFQQGSIFTDGYYSVDNGSKINNKKGGIFSLTGDAGFTYDYFTSDFNNEAGATFRKTGGAATSMVNWRFNNAGTVQVSSGTLALNQGGASGANFTVDSGKFLRFTGGTMTLATGTKLAGAGRIQVEGGTVTGNGAVSGSTTAPGSFDIISGTVNGTMTYSGTGLVNWTGGTIGGTFNLSSGSTLAAFTANNKTFAQKAVFNNSGIVKWSEGSFYTDAYYAPENGSTFNNKAGGVFQLAGDGNPFRIDYFASTFNNEAASGSKAAAKLVKTLGSGTAVLNSWIFNNSGEIGVQVGDISFESTLNLHATTLSGAGRVRFNGTVTADSPIVSTAITQLESGSFTTAKTATTAFIYGGSGPFNWLAGSIGGPFDLKLGSTMNMTGDGLKVLAQKAVLSNYGIINWSAGPTGGGQIYTDAYYDPAKGSTFKNKAGGVFNLKTDGDVFRIDYFASNFINEAATDTRAAGRLFKTAGTGTTTLNDWILTNNGEFTANTGRLDYNATFNMNNGSVFAGAGTHFITGGTATLPGTVTARGTSLTLQDGTLAATAAGSRLVNTSTGALNWTGGVVSGTLTLPAGSTLAIKGPARKTLAQRAVFTNLGTVNFSDAGDIYTDAYYDPAKGSKIVNGTTGVFTHASTGGFNHSYFRSTFTNSGILKIGSPLGIAPMDWIFSQATAGKLYVELGGADAAVPQFDQFNIGGNATLGGTLNVTLLNGYTAPKGTSFKVLGFPSRTGQFATISLPFIGTYNPNDLTITRDGTAPNVAVTSPVKNAALKSLTAVSGVATDSGGTGVLAVDITLRRKVGTAYEYWAQRTVNSVPTYNWGSSAGVLPAVITGNSWSVTANLPAGADLLDGTYLIVANATDKAGNKGSSSPATTVIIDHGAPQIAITTPVNNSLVKALAISGTAQDASLSKVEVKLSRTENGAVQYWAKRGSVFSWDTDVLPVPAVLAGTAPNRTWTVATASLPTGTNLSEGVMTITAVATDGAGNSAATTAATTVTVDKTLPTVAITVPVTKSIAQTIPAISGTATDANLSKVEVKLSRKSGSTLQYWGVRSGVPGWAAGIVTVPATLTGTIPNRTWSVPAASLPADVNMADGVHTIVATATDGAGNAASTVATTVTVDNTDPATVVITAPVQGASVPSLTKVAGTATDNTGGTGVAQVDIVLRRGAAGAYQYWALRGTGSTAAYKWGTTLLPMTTVLSGTGWSRVADLPSGADLPVGAYVVQATAYDKAGNFKSSTETTFNVAAAGSTITVKSLPSTDTTTTASGTASSSSIILSSVSASVPENVQLIFTGAVADSSSDASRYSVTVGNAAGVREVAVESVRLTATGTILLGLEENSLQSGNIVNITYDLKDARGLVLQGTTRVTVR